MIYIETKSVKPYVNLAYEEYFLKNSTCNEPVFMLWRNEPTVVVGRFQNTYNEVNHKVADENGINVIRRITGGGAVYHDLGTLCYTFIARNLSVEKISFSTFALPMIEALAAFGVKGNLSGRNDLTIDGAKFSGTAMSLHKDSLLFHGTILYDTDLSVLSKVLNVKADKLESKGIKSVRSRVTNILPYLKEDNGIEVFKETLKNTVYKRMPFDEYTPDLNDINEIKKLSQKKYQTLDWIYGKNPKAKFHNRKKFPGGELEIYLDLDAYKIKNCKIYGDFLGIKDIESVEKMIEGTYYERKSVAAKLNRINMVEHFGTINKEEFLECLFE